MIELNKNDLLLVAGGVNYWRMAESAAIGVTATLVSAFAMDQLGNMWLGVAVGAGSAILAGVGFSYFSEDTAS